MNSLYPSGGGVPRLSQTSVSALFVSVLYRSPRGLAVSVYYHCPKFPLNITVVEADLDFV